MLYPLYEEEVVIVFSVTILTTITAHTEEVLPSLSLSAPNPSSALGLSLASSPIPSLTTPVLTWLIPTSVNNCEISPYCSLSDKQQNFIFSFLSRPGMGTL